MKDTRRPNGRALGLIAWAFGIANSVAAQAQGASLRMVVPPPMVADTRLSEETQGEEWFDSRAPFDFDLVIRSALA